MDEDNPPPQPLEARPYQLELADYVTNRNGIIYLPTGAGKTFVAILVLKRLAHTLQETIANGGKRAIFMCNTVELARQQARELKKTSLKVGLYIGDRDVDNWNRHKWETEIEECQVLVGTAQIFLDIISQNLLKITDLSLVVIDECHHATGKHPMHEFLSLFRMADQSRLPRVIGLTGVLIKGNKLGNVTEDLRKLESTLRGNIVTVRSTEQMANVMVYATKPIERLVSYAAKHHTFKVEDKVKQIIRECLEFVDNFDIGTVLKLSKGLQQLREPNKKNAIKNLLNDFVYQLDEFGVYAGALAIMSPIIEFEIKKRQSETMRLRDLYRIVITHCERIRHELIKELKSFIDPEEEEQETGMNMNKIRDKDVQRMDVLMNYSSPKLRTLLQYMETCFKGKNKTDIACLIFVQRRYTAKCLYHVILHYCNLNPLLKDVITPQFMVGRENIIGSVESILENKWNKTAIDEFRSKVCNLIVCSNVLEEGIDVQACNYVFAFDPLVTFNSYIQTKGRARSQESLYCIFTPKIEEEKTVGQIKKYRSIHALIRDFLMSRLLELEDPSELEIAEQFVDLIPPFIIPSGAKLLASSALSLLHRYCQSLPWDAFGSCQPWYTLLPANKEGKVAVSLKLPLQSTVRETIVSDYMESNKEAKISAAFKTCKRLYESGELNEMLLPITKAQRVAEVEDILFKHWKKYDDNVCKKLAGKQLRRLYDRKCPEELYESLPRVKTTSYAYAIEFIPQFVENNAYNEHIFKYLKSNATYAILLNRKLPKLAEMPLFMSQGKLSVKISHEPLQCVVGSEQDLLLLKKFHTMIFRDILNIWKEFLVLDHRNKDNSYLIVPLNQKRSIDWQLVRQFQNLKPLREPSIQERRNFNNYRPEDYLDKVVTKWYTPDESERFVVTAIYQNLCPESPFPSNTYKTYADFFASRYNLEVTNKRQFLLEVKPFTQRRNFFNNASNKSTQKEKKRSTIILIPELCHNYQYPGNLWLKALFIPSILNRLYYALHAETLRKRINQFLGLEKYFTNYAPSPLIIDTSLKRVLDDDGNIVKTKDPSKKYLTPYPTKKHTEDYHVRDLEEENIPWKPYTRPIDLNRNFDTSFPVEVQYFIKFINEQKKIGTIDDEDWSNSQFDVHYPKHVDTETEREDNFLSEAMKPLAIKDSSNEIEILKRSAIEAQHLKSAEQYEFLAALTTAGVNDVFDMERYEVLGDAFLKLSVSLYLANKYTTWNEGYLTIVKGRLVSNRNLLYCLMETDICRMICGTSFKPNTTWLPPLCSLPANLLQLLLSNLQTVNTLSPTDFYDLQLTEEEIISGICKPEKLERLQQKCQKSKELAEGGVTTDLENDMNLYLYKDVLRDKVVADTLESILGVCVKNYGLHRTFRMLEFFNICPSAEDSPLTNLLDLKLSSQQFRTSISNREVNSFIPNAHILEKNLCYAFKDRAFLLQALTHPSYPTNRITGCYQELEFIGDAILDMLMTCYIFERFQEMDPGKITDLRSALVNNITLGCICVRRRIHLFMLYENAALSEAITTFVQFQETQDHRVTDQVRILMEESSTEMGKSFRIERSCIVEKDELDNDNDDDDDEEYNFTLNNSMPRKYNMAQKIDVPKALGDVVEALIGAIYLDCRDLNKTWEVIYKLFEYELNEFPRNIPIDPVRQLFEIKHANAKFSAPMTENDIYMVKCIFNCLDESYTTHGFGSNAAQAKKAAAKQALRLLKEHAN